MDNEIEPALRQGLQQAAAYGDGQSNGYGDPQPHFQAGPPQPPTPQQHPAQYAAQACSSCDKQLPHCGLCRRIGRQQRCDYSDESRAPQPSGEEIVSLRQEVAELKHLLTNGLSSARINGSNGAESDISMNSGDSPANFLQPSQWPAPSNFPSLFFYDSAAFEYARFHIQAPHIKVPSGALSALGNSAELRAMIEHYFDTVHTYFPIVSKIRLYQHLSNPLHEPGADIALLFLAMKLLANEIAEGMPAQTQLYQDVKSFYIYLEAQNGFSIQMIQALLLTSLYEIGHGIYPAAYLTVGNAARVGHAVGLHAREVPQMLQRCTTWTEQEERRRVWWGVLILDRFVNIGHRGKPFASAEPSLDMHLPTDDAAWDRGQMLTTAPLSLSASRTIKASAFARACQSIHLAGKVIQHLDDRSIPVDYRFEEALRLHRGLRALASTLPSEAEDDDPTIRPTLCTAMATCYSALLTLYDRYCCTESSIPDGPESQLVMQKESIDGIAAICDCVLQLARRMRENIDRVGNLSRLSPLTIQCLYEAGANYAWYLTESSEPVHAEKLAEIKELLIICDRRWRIAGQYLFTIDDYWQRGCGGMIGPGAYG